MVSCVKKIETRPVGRFTPMLKKKKRKKQKAKVGQPANAKLKTRWETSEEGAQLLLDYGRVRPQPEPP